MILNSKANQKIEELQVIENNLQNFLSQKQAIQIELNGVENAINELKESDDEVYKIVSSVMLKTTKTKLNEHLEEKKKLLEMKIDSVEKQEKILEKRSLELRKEIDNLIGK